MPTIIRMSKMQGTSYPDEERLAVREGLELVNVSFTDACKKECTWKLLVISKENSIKNVVWTIQCTNISRNESNAVVVQLGEGWKKDRSKRPWCCYLSQFPIRKINAINK